MLSNFYVCTAGSETLFQTLFNELTAHYFSTFVAGDMIHKIYGFG